MSKVALDENKLLDQSVALQSYMQELLNEVTWQEPELEAVSEPEPNSEPVPVLPTPQVQTLAELEAEFDDERYCEDIAVETTQNKTIGHSQPDWARNSFHALHAAHGRLRMLLPLVHVQTVLRATELVRVSGPLTVLVGYVQQGSNRIPVLDLNNLNEVTEKEQSDDIESEKEGYVAIAEDCSVGLYFKSINDTQEVDSKSISWRCRDDLVTWIAGVDPENLSVVVDINFLRDLL